MTKTQRIVLFVSIMASFVSTLDGFVVNVALPAISRELGGGLVTQQWVVNAYMITLGSLMLLAGSLSDIFGRKRIVMIGLAGFGVTSLLCAVAPTALFLIIARGLQGIAGALLVPSSLALIISHFKGEAQGKAIGTWTAWGSIAALVGPMIGGFIVDVASWRLILGINVLPIAITLWLASRLEFEEEQKGARIDLLGASLGIIGLGGVVFAFIEQTRFGWTSPVIYWPLVIGLLASALFVWYEKRTKNPMVPLELFGVRNFSFGNIATIFMYAALALSSFVITIYLQQGAHFSAFQAGLVFLPLTIVMFACSSLAGKLAGKYGPHWFMTIGPMLMGLGFLWMTTAVPPVNYWTEILPGILLMGVGLAATVSPLTSAVLGSIPSVHAGIGSAINNAISRVAGLIAISAIGLFVGPTLGTPEAFQRGITVMVVLIFLSGIVSAIGIRNARSSAQHNTAPLA
jgi:EmrB/QacA subfamily drug resistance transporter